MKRNNIMTISFTGIQNVAGIITNSKPIQLKMSSFSLTMSGVGI